MVADYSAVENPWPINMGLGVQEMVGKWWWAVMSAERTLRRLNAYVKRI
jgi:hypothetical protein